MKKKKLALNKTTIRNLVISEVAMAAGGISVDPCSASCAGGCNTLFRCVDTNAASNCGGACNTTLVSFQCATLLC